jgi:hypothetical protein
MRICIICEDKWVEEVRESSKDIIPGHNNLSIPLSPTGEFPATHWLCVCNVNEEIWKKFEERRKYTQMYQSLPSVLLEELKLKRIGKK